MKALTVIPGVKDSLELRDMPEPEPAEGQVRPPVVTWMRRTFAATYVVLAGRLALQERPS